MEELLYVDAKRGVDLSSAGVATVGQAPAPSRSQPLENSLLKKYAGAAQMSHVRATGLNRGRSLLDLDINPISLTLQVLPSIPTL